MNLMTYEFGGSKGGSKPAPQPAPVPVTNTVTEIKKQPEMETPKPLQDRQPTVVPFEEQEDSILGV